MAKARAAGSFLGGIFNNPGIVIIAAIGLALFIFKDRISEAFGSIGQNFGNIELPDINLPDINLPDINFPEFPEFPEFPDFGDFFDFFGGGRPVHDDDHEHADLPPDVEDTGLLTPEERARCECGTNVIQDIQGDVSETCISPCTPEEGDDDFIGPTQCVDFPVIGVGMINSCTGVITPFGEGGFVGPPEPPEEPEPDEPFEPPVELPEGFEGGGPSFEGGQIFEGSDSGCNDLTCVLFWNPTFTASQAANRLAEIQGTFGDFDFGTNTGSGFGPGDDQTGSIVTGGATPESEEKRAACLTCELFGLNCGICAGTI